MDFEYSKHDWIAAFICFIVLSVLGAFVLNTGLSSWGDDHSAYLNEAKAIAEGTFKEQLRLNYYMHPTIISDESKQGELVYSWGYPLILSMVYKIVGFDMSNYSQIIWYKVPNILFLAVLGSSIFLLYRRRFSLWLSILACTIFCFHSVFINALNGIGNDLPFLTLSVLSLLMLEIFLDHINKQYVLFYATLLGAILWLTYETRLNGFTIVITCLVGNCIFLLNRRKDQEIKKYLLRSVCVYFVLIILILTSDNLFFAPATPNLTDYNRFTLGNFDNNLHKYNSSFKAFLTQFLWGKIYR